MPPTETKLLPDAHVQLFAPCVIGHDRTGVEPAKEVRHRSLGNTDAWPIRAVHALVDEAVVIDEAAPVCRRLRVVRRVFELVVDAAEQRVHGATSGDGRR